MVSSFGWLKREERGRRRKTGVLAIVALIAVLVIVVLAGLYIRGAFPWLFSENPRYSHSFSLVIDPETAPDFTVICPVPVDAGGSPYQEFINELEVTSGDPQCALVETEHGFGLLASGSGYTSLHWRGDWSVGDGDWFLNLSMTNAPNDWDYDTPEGGFWSWVHSTNETLSISLVFRAERIHNETPIWTSGGGPSFRITGTIAADGWSKVLIDYGWIVIN